MQYQSAIDVDDARATPDAARVGEDSFPLVDLSDVAFALVGNTAVLTGTVSCEADRRTILLALELVPGIDAILDLLRVRD
ncbi:MAG TPA: hypothetical protein VM734_05375 [Kofleriaceae bacterium]|jgi:hypothetical protein|nr:hypothetical protein [Kofleriaceae bacterium]